MSTMNNIENQHAVLTLEADSGADAGPMVKRLPAFLQSVRNFVKNLFSFETKKTDFVIDKNVVIKLGQLNYTEIKDLQIPVPVGLKVSYAQYLEVLVEASDAILNLKPHVLEPFNRWVGYNLSNPANLANMRADTSLVKDIRFSKLEQISKDLSACFDSGKGNVNLPFKQAFKQIREWELVMMNAEKLDQILASVTREEIMTLVDQISTKFNTLFKRVEEDPQHYALSPVVTKTASDLSLAVAKECEFYTVFYFQVLGLLSALNGAEDKIRNFDSASVTMESNPEMDHIRQRLATMSK